MKIGYARVSTNLQILDLQLKALNEAHCDRIFTDHMSGAKTDRPGLAEALDHLREGDTLVVWKLDRLGRSLKHLITTVEGLHERGVNFQSLTEAIDTSTPTGKFFFHMIGSLAEFERDLIRERSIAGRIAAEAQGRKGGRPKRISPDQVAVAQKLLSDPLMSVSKVARSLKVDRVTLYRALKRAESQA